MGTVGGEEMPAIIFRDRAGWAASIDVFDELNAPVTVVRNPEDDDRPIHIIGARSWPRLVGLLEQAAIPYDVVTEAPPTAFPQPEQLSSVNC